MPVGGKAPLDEGGKNGPSLTTLLCSWQPTRSPSVLLQLTVKCSKEGVGKSSLLLSFCRMAQIQLSARLHMSQTWANFPCKMKYYSKLKIMQAFPPSMREECVWGVRMHSLGHIHLWK